MFVSTLVQVRAKHFPEVKYAASMAGLTVVNFGAKTPESKSVMVGVQGSDKKVPSFIKVLTDARVGREVVEGGVFDNVTTEALTA
jgi:hypothetical protein